MKLDAFSDELRLTLIVLLNGGVFAAAYRFARRRGAGGAVQAVCDAFLLYFLVQYAAVALPGVVGAFHVWTMSLVALTAATGLWIAAHYPRSAVETPPAPSNPAPQKSPPAASRKPPHSRQILEYAPRPANAAHAWNADRFGLLACALFAAAFLGAFAYDQRWLPPLATDSLVYHLPMAVQWIQEHRLTLYPTWYWNPAASYSPGTGAIFMAWWMAPAGNDVFVRFVQLPPLLFIFFVLVRICRLMGCSRSVAGLIAVAATLSRPLISEAIFPKDDLFVTSFIAAAVLALADAPMRDRFSPWRVGIALGFVLASKYTVLLACPVFLFMIDAPRRARWRGHHWAIAIALVLLMALPWYVRNVVLTGNPLYPVDVKLLGPLGHGLFGVERDEQLRTAGGVWKMLATTYHSLPTSLIVLLLAGWIGAAVAAWRSVLRDPLQRAAVIGTAFTLVLFLITSPHHEVRYLFPLMVLLFAVAGLAIARIAACIPTRFAAKASLLTPGRVQFVFALVLAVLSIATSFDISQVGKIESFSVTALLVSAIGVGMGIGIMFLRPLLAPAGTNIVRWFADKPVFVGIVAHVFASLFMWVVILCVVALFADIEWQPYLQSYREVRFFAWSIGYGQQAPLWQYVDAKIPADATVAYGNTFFIYPFQGFNFTRRVSYAPVRAYPKVHRYSDDDFLNFPRMGDRVPGDLIVRRMTEVMNESASRTIWLAKLRKAGADYLVVMKHDSDDLAPDLNSGDEFAAHVRIAAPELRFARQEKESAVFERMYEDDAGIVYRIHWK